MNPDGRRGLPIVAIVGRPNVGKSMLFNRLTGCGTAVVDDEPGVTRDRNYLNAEWNGRHFLLVDTGGLVPQDDEGISGMIRIQAESAIDEADAIVFVVDRTTGPLGVDVDIAALLRRSTKPVILAVNKVDSGAHEQDVHEFHGLGLGEPHSVSALHGRRTGDLLDEIVAAIPEAPLEEQEPGIRVALVGRPNVGKSSLVNRIVGEDVVLVDSEPGTTRDAIDTVVVYEDQRYVLVDTAGLRKKSRIERGVELYSSMRALRSIEHADVVVLVVDAELGIVAQDARIAGFADEEGKGLILAYNKWDLIEKNDLTAGEFAQRAKDDLPFARYAPVVQVSALSGQRVRRILSIARDIYEGASLRLSTHQVTEFIRKSADRRPPKGGRRSSIMYATQIGVRPPTFVVFVKDVRALDHSYRRYLANQLREEYGFAGTPIRIVARKKH
jgi:GTP-binding protein